MHGVEETMTETTEKTEQPEQAAEELPEPAPAAPAGRVAAVTALLLALIALAAGGAGLYYAWQQHNVAGARKASLQQLQDRLESLQKSVTATDSRSKSLGDRLDKLGKQQSQLRDSLNTLYSRQQRNSNDWAVAEIEHLMIIAVQSLTLQKDVGTALAALQDADKRIRNLGDPGLLPVRRQLASDINSLRAVNDVDINGLSLYLTDVVNRVGDLPLKEQAVVNGGGAERQENTDQLQNLPAWKKVLVEVWHELKSLVVITRSDKGGAALLMPDEKYFLFQNLRLQLESARLSVFRHDTDTFHASVDIVIQWLRKYFDVSDAAVSNIIESLTRMKQVNLNPKLPDISSSLETLHAYMKKHGDEAASSGQGESSP